MKAKDLILAINEHVNSNELSALAGSSAFNEVDVQDETVTEVKKKLSGLMSLESAQNNPELSEYFKKKLHPAIKGELFGNIDTDILQKSKQLFGEDVVKEFEGLDFTGDKIKKLFDLTTKTLAEKATDPKLKQVNDDLKKQIEELNNGFSTKLSEKENEIKKINEDFKSKLIQKEFNGLMSTYKLGDKYNDDFIRESLTNKMFSEVQKQAKLIFNEEGKVVPKNPTDAELDIYINNKKIENVKDLLDPLMEPYITKKAEGPNKPTYKPSEPQKVGSLAADFIRQRQELNNK